MDTAVPIAMPTDAQILTLTQWFSPGYPIGAFSYSHGLEQMCCDGHVTHASDLQNFIEDVLRHGAGRADALFLAASFRADTLEDVAAIDARCRAFAPSRERLQETALQGAAFGQITAHVWGDTPQTLCYPVAVGQAARRLGLPPILTCAMYLHAFVSNLAAAGQRLAGIGQSQAQSVIQALAGLCSQIAEETIEGDLEQLSGTAFVVDIASMQHETQYSRIFRT